VEQGRGSARRQKRQNRLIKMLIARLVRRPPATTARSSAGVASRGVREYLPLNSPSFPPAFSSPLLSSPRLSVAFLFSPSLRPIIYIDRSRSHSRAIWIITPRLTCSRVSASLARSLARSNGTGSVIVMRSSTSYSVIRLLSREAHRASADS